MEVSSEVGWAQWAYETEVALYAHRPGGRRTPGRVSVSGACRGQRGLRRTARVAAVSTAAAASS